MCNETLTYTLNDYQQLMLKISDLTPFSAVHAVQLQLKDHEISELQTTLAQAIDEVIQGLNLGIPVFLDHRKKVYFKSFSDLKLKIIESTLSEHVHYEMNRAFDENELPLRFFLVITNQDCYFSITYNHWIADAYSISRLMEAILQHDNHQKPSELRLSSENMQTYFPSIYGVKAWIYRATGIVKNLLRFSSAYRPPMHNSQLLDCGSCYYFFQKDTLLSLKQYCKQEKITLNDFFLCILAKLFGDMTKEDRMKCQKKSLKPKRNKIIIAVISNIRQQSMSSLDYIFSLCLGFFYLSFQSPEQQSFQALSRSIHLQTQRFKNNRSALKQSLLFKIQNWLWDKQKNPQSRYRLFFKNTPITVGISNMDMRHLEYNHSLNVERYIRFSPTAMICPISFNLTSFQEHLSLGINYHKGYYNAQTIEDIQCRFVEEICSILASAQVNLNSDQNKMS